MNLHRNVAVFLSQMTLKQGNAAAAQVNGLIGLGHKLNLTAHFPRNGIVQGHLLFAQNGL